MKGDVVSLCQLQAGRLTTNAAGILASAPPSRAQTARGRQVSPLAQTRTRRARRPSCGAGDEASGRMAGMHANPVSESEMLAGQEEQ